MFYLCGYYSMLACKVLMQGKQFVLGGICKQEQMHQCSFSIRGGEKHLILIILKIHIIIHIMTRIFHLLFCGKGIPCQAVTSILCLLFCPKAIHCSTKNAYTSEITFLALVPCLDGSAFVKHQVYANLGCQIWISLARVLILQQIQAVKKVFLSTFRNITQIRTEFN